MTNKKMTKDEAIAKLFEVSLDYFKQSDELYEKHLDLKEKRIKSTIDFKLSQEPLKIFKKAHKKWEEELAELNQELNDFYVQVYEFYKEQYEFYKKLSEA